MGTNAITLTVKYQFYWLKAPPADPCKVFPKNSWHLKKSYPHSWIHLSHQSWAPHLQNKRSTAPASRWYQQPSGALPRCAEAVGCVHVCGHLLGGQSGELLPSGNEAVIDHTAFTMRFLVSPLEPLFPPTYLPSPRFWGFVHTSCPAKPRSVPRSLPSYDHWALWADVPYHTRCLHLWGILSWRPGSSYDLASASYPQSRAPPLPLHLTCLYEPGNQLQMESLSPHPNGPQPDGSVHGDRCSRTWVLFRSWGGMFGSRFFVCFLALLCLFTLWFYFGS